MLTEEEISDVSLGTFYVFDKKELTNPGRRPDGRRHVPRPTTFPIF
jgi:hypothetical protein